MAKEKKCPPCVQEVPAYMMTYGDLMTLLVVFFVLLLSFSSVQESEFNKASGSLQGALGVLMATQGTAIKTNNLPLINNKKGGDMEFKIKRILKELEDKANKAGMNEMVKFSESKDRIHFSISNPMLFISGSDNLNSAAFPIIEEISKVLKLTDYEVKIEGHTDNIPIRSQKFRSNWELSMKRALSVSEKLLEFGVQPERFQVTGFGEFRPIADNSTSEGRGKNRRVEIYVNLREEDANDLSSQYQY